MAPSPDTTVAVAPIDPQRLAPILGDARVAELIVAADRLRQVLAGRRIVNVNSTATGGGVAEMLASLVGYALGAGLETDWLVIDGDPEFFEVTKRVHNGLYGAPGDGGELGPAEHAHYERVTRRNLERIRPSVRPGDVVIVHDPQPAGLIGPLAAMGAHVIWRCHVGHDSGNEWTERAWAFVRPYVEPAHAFVFSREPFAPAWIERARLRAIPPSIDPFAPKNRELRGAEVPALLRAAALLAGDGALHPLDPRVRHAAVVVRDGDPLHENVPLVVQVSRWDRMKDMAGVMHGFVEHVPAGEARLVLAGPETDGVDDDPEGAEVWHETVADWRRLPQAARARVQLVAISMADPVENALVVNALQRHAAVVVQKSLAEGFGLTVAEAMWKARPVVASAVGGIVDQVVDGETGLLVDDPSDLAGFGAAVARLLGDPVEAERLGRNARRHVEQRFLGDRHLLDYATLLEELVVA
jgi:trehalose synthase